MGKSLSVLDKVFVGILLVIFGAIVLHAPIAVGFSTLWPDYSLFIKSWKEILLGVALLLYVVIVTTKKQWPAMVAKVNILIAVFALVNVALIPVMYTGFDATVAALFINLRFLLFFVLVYGAVKLYPQLTHLFIRVGIGGALVVIGFAVLQLTVLPNDVLRHIGYNESTIMPYLTVDQNEDYIRINSTLRGPNPLGVYAVIVLAAVVTVLLKTTRAFKKHEKVLLWALGLGAAAALWASYSRSAALAGLAAVAVVVLAVYGRRITKAVWVGVAVAGLALTGSLVAFQDTQFVSQVILHEDPHEGNDVNSNDGHVESLVEGTTRMIRQPLGGGVGSTGSASLLTDDPIIIENQYLFVAHESGWLGLGLFIAINYFVLRALWQRRSNWLALSVFASGVGMVVACMFLPVWVDDTVSIVWWGAAAVALAVPFASPAAAKPIAKKKRKVA